MKHLLLFTLFFAIVSTAKAQNDPSLTVGDTGTITFQYRGSTVTYTTVRAADGLIWLQQNLGATQVADSATDTAAYGHYFQWGRWDDGHQVPTSDTAHAHGLAINNPAGIPNGSDKFFVDTSAGANPWWANGDSNNTWTNAPPSDSNGYDPCAALGPNWHMPSKSEFSNLVAIEGISANTSAFSSNLKLPMAGTRHYIDTFFIGVHNSSAYWTSSVVDSLANTVYITSTVDTNHPVYKGYGRSVRCVTTCTGVYSPDTLLGPDTVCANSAQTWQTPPVTYANSYTWALPTGASIIGPQNGNSITVMMGTGSGTITVRASNACDTSIAISRTVFVHPLPNPVISQSGWSLSTGTFNSYQWLLNNNPIPGATTNPYTATNPGIYRVIVTDANGCTDTSAALSLSVHGASTSKSNIEVFPNPATTQLFIKAAEPVYVSIYSSDGRLAVENTTEKTIDISTLSPGYYQLKIADKEGTLLKLEKLVVLPH